MVPNICKYYGGDFFEKARILSIVFRQIFVKIAEESKLSKPENDS